MLTAAHIGNFKAFGETQTIPLNPITLTFGPNSSGKSSILHALALAHEANRTGNLDVFVFRAEIGGGSIDLGAFRRTFLCATKSVARRVVCKKSLRKPLLNFKNGWIEATGPAKQWDTFSPFSSTAPSPAT